MTFLPDKNDSAILIKEENIGLFTKVTCKFIGSVVRSSNACTNLEIKS